MSTPRISVLMPVYNAADYVAEAIESILAQTWNDFEFIIIDNGSTDGLSGAIIGSYVDSRIRVISNEVNVPPPCALNQGLALAQGAYVARMDADDVALPRRFEEQVRFIESHPQCAVVGTQAMHIDESGKDIYAPRYPTEQDEIFWRLLSTSPLGHSSVLMLRAPVQRLGGYDEGLRNATDYALWSTMWREGYEIHNLAERLMLIRLHANSDERVSDPDAVLKEVAGVTQTNFARLLDLAITDEQALAWTRLHRNSPQAQRGDVALALNVVEQAANCVGPRCNTFYALTMFGLALSPASISPPQRFFMFLKALNRTMRSQDRVHSALFVLQQWILNGRAAARLRFAWRGRFLSR